MFKKLLKYDFKSVRRFAIPLLFVVLGITVIGAVDVFFFVRNMYMDISPTVVVFEGMLVTFLVITILGLVAVSILIEVFILVDFFRTLSTDQAYLTLTLPVKSESILGSKLLNSVIWSVIIDAAVLLSIIIILVSGFVSDSIFSDYRPLPDDGIVNDPSMPGEMVSGILGIIVSVLSTVNTKMLMFMAIFFASIVSKKNKATTALAFVFLAAVAYSIISSMIGLIVALSVDYSNPYVATIITNSIYIVLLAGSGVAYFFATKYMMDKKLNLP